MTVYSIGREAGCNIVIDDRTDVISRRHATLNVESNGKMTIIDQSSNGTYVNGIRITSGVPVPVTRKDNVSFAHVARLDWNRIPDTRANIIRWVIVAAVAILLVAGGIILFNVLTRVPELPTPQHPTLFTPEEMEKRAREKSDSIQKHVRDSLRNDSIKKDSIKRVQQKPARKPSPKPKHTPKSSPKPQTKKETTKPTRLGR